MSEELNRRRREPSGEERPRRRKRKKKSAGRTVGRVIITLLLIALTTSALLACFAAVYIKNVIIPDAPLDLSWFDADLSTTLYYQNKETGEYTEELQSLHGTKNRVWVDFDHIPKYLRDAAVAIEDRRFYEHGGVDWIRTAKGLLCMFTGGDIQGGSTITQQLIKNLTGHDEVTVRRKILEIFRALEFDKTYSKDYTLEWYLNYIYLGSGCYGVSTAANEYFGKDVSELSLAECASLIGITNNPSIFSPNSTLRVVQEDGTVKTAIDFNKERQELILWCMLDQGKITQEEYDAAMAEELVFHSMENGENQKESYSWYEDQVIVDVTNDLMEKLKISKELAQQMIFSGGLKIYTCIDPDVQAIVDRVYEDRANLNYTSSDGQKMESAITILDNQTGNVVAMAGGMGVKEGSQSWNRAVRTIRQPGSSIKPLAVYAPALELGLISPGTVVDDYPYQLLGGKAWPVNSYSNYRGLMTVYEAVQDSANTAAVRVLGDYLSPSASYQFMTERFHISTLVENRVARNGRVQSDLGLAQLALGGLTDGVNTLEMAAAYRSFPTGGIYTKPRTYTQVYDRDGNLLLDNTAESEVIMKDTTAFYINYMLQGVVSGGTGTAADFSGMTIAGKTGTTSENYDRWFVGYTPYYTAAVWTGYDRNAKMRTSGNPSVQLWKKVMQPLHQGLQNKRFDQPNSIVSVSFCKDSGMLATEACQADSRGSRVTTGFFIKGEDVPTEYCTAHVTVEYCTADPILGEDGTVTGYHLAGEHCPAETRITASGVNYVREPIGGAVARDSGALLSGFEEIGTCRVHDGTYIPPEPTLPVETDPIIDPPPTETVTPPVETPPVETPPPVDPNQP